MVSKETIWNEQLETLEDRYGLPRLSVEKQPGDSVTYNVFVDSKQIAEELTEQQVTAWLYGFETAVEVVLH